jgi:hypothetical protein
MTTGSSFILNRFLVSGASSAATDEDEDEDVDAVGKLYKRILISFSV